MTDIVLSGVHDDSEWEAYIRAANPAAAIFERAKRVYEFQQHCQREHGKQGGSHFSEFMAARFQIDKATAANWALIGADALKLLGIVQQFAPDFISLRDFTRLPPDQQQKLLAAPGTLDRKAVSSFKAQAR